METAILGHDERAIGVEVYDEKEIRHIVNVEWGGEIEKHTHEEDAYPYNPEDRTEDQQRIMNQVEERAKYEAHKQFPDADILDPMWDPEHIERGLEALTNYPLNQFREHFRDFYEATAEPGQFIDEPFDLETVTVLKPYQFRDAEIVDIGEVFIEYETNGQIAETGTLVEYPEDEQIACTLPAINYAPDYDYTGDFHDTVVNHLLAQIRDLYLNMGETPPPEYQVEGIGKFNIHGDGIGET